MNVEPKDKENQQEEKEGALIVPLNLGHSARRLGGQGLVKDTVDVILCDIVQIHNSTLIYIRLIIDDEGFLILPILCKMFYPVVIVYINIMRTTFDLNF